MIKQLSTYLKDKNIVDIQDIEKFITGRQVQMRSSNYAYVKFGEKLRIKLSALPGVKVKLLSVYVIHNNFDFWLNFADLDLLMAYNVNDIHDEIKYHEERKAETDKEISVLRDRLIMMEELGVNKIDDDTIRVYGILKILKDKKMPIIEQAKEIKKLLDTNL